MKGNIIKNPPKKLFHLSEVNHDGEWFYPRIPKSVCLDAKEDNRTKRVCFSSTICGAFFAISFFGDRQKLYVHTPCNLDKIYKKGKLYKPTEKQVFDAPYTREYWIKSRVKLRCIGLISIKYKETIFGTKFYFKWLKI